MRTRADIARDWGWRPEKTNEDFLNTFEDEADAILEKLDESAESLSFARQFQEK